MPRKRSSPRYGAGSDASRRNAVSYLIQSRLLVGDRVTKGGLDDDEIDASSVRACHRGCEPCFGANEPDAFVGRAEFGRTEHVGAAQLFDVARNQRVNVGR